MKYKTLYILNKFLFQWLFIRITMCTNIVYDKVKLTGVSLMSNGEFSSQMKPYEHHTETWISIQYWIIPLTGWNTPFKSIGNNRRFKRITNKKKVYN